MKLRTTTAVFLLTAALAVPAYAGPSPVGNWQVVKVVAKGKSEAPPPQVKVTIEFTKDGKFFMRMKATAPDGKVHKKEDGGTYEVKGNKLVTTVKKKVETSTFAVKGGLLTLEKAGQDAKLILKRAAKVADKPAKKKGGKKKK